MKLINKRARFDYQILDTLEVGIALSGAEVKSLRDKRGNISQSFAKIIGNEIYLINANIPTENIPDANPTRTRKLLLHRKQIVSLISQMNSKKLTLVPLSLYTKGRLIKLELALAKHKREFEKREKVKKQDIQRDLERELKDD